MTELPLWLALTRNTEADRSALRDAHRAYMRALVERGVVFASGPVAHAHDAESYGGATVLRVADEAEARRIMDDEPYIQGGTRTYELIAWTVAHGDYSSR